MRATYKRSADRCPYTTWLCALSENKCRPREAEAIQTRLNYKRVTLPGNHGSSHIHLFAPALVIITLLTASTSREMNSAYISEQICEPRWRNTAPFVPRHSFHHGCLHPRLDFTSGINSTSGNLIHKSVSFKNSLRTVCALSFGFGNQIFFFFSKNVIKNLSPRKALFMELCS